MGISAASDCMEIAENITLKVFEMFFDSTSEIIASTDRDVFHSLQGIMEKGEFGGEGAGR
jgi:hypothetical protein